MREKLLDAAQTLVQDRGLDAVSFQDLANAVGLRKPSVFHYFSSKDALAESLMERCRATYGAHYREILESGSTAPEKLRAIAAVFEKNLRKDRICLLTALGSSWTGFSEKLKGELKGTSEASVDTYTRIFEQGRNENTLRFAGEPRDAATAFMGMLQGLQVLARSEGEHEAFSPAVDSYIKSISI